MNRPPNLAQLMGTLHHLAVEAFRAPSREALCFRLVNETVRLAPYERAALWSFEAGAPSLLAVSGQQSTDPYAPLPSAWRKLVIALPEKAKAQPLTPEPFGAEPEAWRLAVGEGRQILWCPILEGGALVAALWLERPAGSGWSPEEAELLAVLMESYAVALAARRPRALRLRRWFAASAVNRLAGLVLLLAFIYGLAIHPFPLRVIAPCQVIPADPHWVTAPLEGRLVEILVRPGDWVEANKVLARIDGEERLRAREVAAQDVEAAALELRRLTTLALAGEESPARLGAIESRLAQARARLSLADLEVERLTLTAPIAGRVEIASPEGLVGRVVRPGERLMRILDPKQSSLMLWIAEADKVQGLEREGAEVILDTDPGEVLRAKLSFTSSVAEISPDGVPSFVLRAEWEGARVLPLGARGTAILRGEPASLAYWVLRKPWATVRRWFGW